LPPEGVHPAHAGRAAQGKEMGDGFAAANRETCGPGEARILVLDAFNPERPSLTRFRADATMTPAVRAALKGLSP